MRSSAALLAAALLAAPLAACGHAPATVASTSLSPGVLAGPALTNAAATLGGACANPTEMQSVRSSDLLVPSLLHPSVGSDLHTIITRHRPRWLSSRGMGGSDGNASVVYLDGVRYGGVESLRSFLGSSVELVRYLSAPQAHFKYGANHPNGVIELFTRCGS